jgi:hypothetical protein
MSKELMAMFMYLQDQLAMVGALAEDRSPFPLIYINWFTTPIKILRGAIGLKTPTKQE